MGAAQSLVDAVMDLTGANRLESGQSTIRVAIPFPSTEAEFDVLEDQHLTTCVKTLKAQIKREPNCVLEAQAREVERLLKAKAHNKFRKPFTREQTFRAADLSFATRKVLQAHNLCFDKLVSQTHVEGDPFTIPQLRSLHRVFTRIASNHPPSEVTEGDLADWVDLSSDSWSKSFYFRTLFMLVETTKPHVFTFEEFILLVERLCTKDKDSLAGLAFATLESDTQAGYVEVDPLQARLSRNETAQVNHLLLQELRGFEQEKRRLIEAGDMEFLQRTIVSEGRDKSQFELMNFADFLTCTSQAQWTLFPMNWFFEHFRSSCLGTSFWEARTVALMAEREELRVAAMRPRDVDETTLAAHLQPGGPALAAATEEALTQAEEAARDREAKLEARRLAKLGAEERKKKKRARKKSDGAVNMEAAEARMAQKRAEKAAKAAPERVVGKDQHVMSALGSRFAKSDERVKAARREATLRQRANKVAVVATDE